MVRIVVFLFVGLAALTGAMLDYSLAAKSRGAAYSVADHVATRLSGVREFAAAVPMPGQDPVVAPVASVAPWERGFMGAARPFPVNMIDATFLTLRVMSGGAAPAVAVPEAGIDVAGPAEIDEQALVAAIEAEAEAAAQAAGEARQTVGRLTDRECAVKAGTKFCSVAPSP